jgi:hypothetical protein
MNETVGAPCNALAPAPERGFACVIQASGGKMRHNADCATLESPEERS